MRPQPPDVIARPKSAPKEYSTAAAVEDLIESVVHVLDDHGGVQRPAVLRRIGDVVEEVICDTEIEGVRYYLIRCLPQETGAALLSPRELAIAQLIAKGLPNKGIGDILEISPWTVATHLRRIFMKLGVNSRAAMVARLRADQLL
jgi:DNA-binding CsgD family transcriptional regulator